jgi:hypothetical protein
MPRKVTLRKDDLEQLETALKDERVEVRQRAAALRAVHLGKPVKEGALVLAVTEALAGTRSGRVGEATAARPPAQGG